MGKINRPGYRFPYNLKECWLNPRWYYKEAKRFIQRGFNGYDETTHWNLDYEVAELILATLPRLKDSGVPLFYYAEICNEKERPAFDRTRKITKRMQKAATKLRNSEIDYITENFEKYIEDDWSDSGVKAMELFTKRFGSWWS